MRTWHRGIMTAFWVTLTYWVVSGLTMAVYDATDHTQVWAIHGGGPGARLTDDAVGATPLADPASIAAGVKAALRDSSSMTIASADLRMVGSSERLQLAEAHGADGGRATMRRYFADTGRPMSALVADGDPDAQQPPNVERREFIKRMHRGNFTGENLPGLVGEVIGVLTGIALLGMTLTGLILYFKLWIARRRIRRRNFFWASPNENFWRRFHRSIAILLSAFILNKAITGVILGFAELQVNTFLTYHVGTPPYIRPSPLPAMSSSSLPPNIDGMLQVGYRAARMQNPERYITSITLVNRGDGVAKALVTLGGLTPRTLAYNAQTGASVDDWATSGTQVGNGYFADWHQVVKRMHRGDVIGSFSGRYIDIVIGFGILYLSVSGLAMYIKLLRQRLRMGRNTLFWR